MNYEAFKREALAHYIRMAQTPGWKAQAWHSVNELAKNHPCLFADMPELLKQAMQSLSSAPAADSPTSQASFRQNACGNSCITTQRQASSRD